MADPDGFLTLARKLFASDLWNRAEPFDSRSAFIDLLRRASFTARAIRTQGREVQLLPGETLLDTRALSRRWGWSRSKVTRFLRQLRERGTLTYRPAWGRETTTKAPPWIYSFPNYQKHQKPWEGMTPASDAGKGPATTATSPHPRRRDVTPAKKQELTSDAGTWRRETPMATGILSDQVTPGRDAGSLKSDAGNIQLPPNDSPSRDAGRESRSFKNTVSPIYLNSTGTTFDQVQELASFADRLAWGNGDNPHRGYNIQTLVKLVNGGTPPDTLAHIIRGTRLLVDAGRVPWVEPGAGFSLAAIWGDQRHIEDRSLSSIAFETSQGTDT